MALSMEAERAEYEEYERPDSEEEWLELRRPWWNASLAGRLFDEHEYVTLGDAVTEFLRPEFEVIDEDRAKLFRRGLLMEPYVAAIAQEHLGKPLVDARLMYRRGCILSTPDREIVGEKRGVEIKSTRTFLRGAIKRYWWWQAQAQCWCADWDMVYIAALDASLEVTIYPVDRDEDAIRRMVDKATLLMESIDWGDVPVGVELSAGNVSAIWPKDSGSEAEVGADVVPLLAEYLEARANEKQWKERKEGLRDRCVAELGPDSTALVDDEPVFSYKASKDRDVVDYKALAADPRVAPIVSEFTTTKPGARTFRPNERSIRTMQERMGDVDF